MGILHDLLIAFDLLVGPVIDLFVGLFKHPAIRPYLVGPIASALLWPVRRYLPKTGRPWSPFLIAMTLPSAVLMTNRCVFQNSFNDPYRSIIDVMPFPFVFLFNWIPFSFQVAAFVSYRRSLLKYAKWLTAVGYILPTIVTFLAYSY